MRVLASLLLVLCIGAGAPPLAVIDAKTIDTVKIDVVVGALGPGTNYHKIYRRQNLNWFATDDRGARFTQWDLEALTGALQEPALKRFEFSRTWITREILAKGIDVVEPHYLGPHRTDPKIEPIFRRVYLNWDELARRCNAAMAADMFMSDYYPDITITLSAAKRDVVLWTKSQRNFVLPIHVNSAGAEQKTWDPELSLAIADLFGEKTPMMEMFSGIVVLPQWASAASEAHDVYVAIHGKDDRPKVFQEGDVCRMPGYPYAPY